MKLITKLRKADFSKKTQLWLDADLLCWQAEDLVKEMILSLPGYYRVVGRDTCANLVDKIYETYGWMPSMFVSENLLRGMAVQYPGKIYVAFTHGLDVVEVKP